MASNSDPLRQLKIKTGVVKRLGKEKISYEKESAKDKERVEKMKQEGKDEYDIRKQEEVAGESLAMIPDCKRRLKAAWQDLDKLIVDCGKELEETEEYKNAVTVREDNRAEASD